MLKKFLFLVLTVFVLNAVTGAEAESKNSSEIKKYHSGVYINRINSFDVKTGVAEIDIWYWCVTDKAEASLQTLDLSNGKLEAIGEPVKQKYGNRYYVSRRYLAQVQCLIDISRFPFDKQQIVLAFEDGEFTSDQMVFSPDIRNSGIDPAFKMGEWDIAQISYKTGSHNYPTSFGYLDIPSGQGSDYSQMLVVIDLNRKGTVCQKLFKYFWAVFVSLIVGLVSLFIRVCDLDGRFGMEVGSLFANVGCSFILVEKLPESPGLSLAEHISYFSLGFIMLFIVESIISLALYNRDRQALSRKLDIGTFVAGIFGYALMWVILWVILF